MRKYGINWLSVYVGLVFSCGVGTVWWDHIRWCLTGRTPHSIPHMIFSLFFQSLLTLLLGLGLARLLHKADRKTEQKVQQQPEGIALPVGDTPVPHAATQKPLPLREFVIGMYGLACAVVGGVSFAAHFTGRVTTGGVITFTLLVPLSFVMGLLIILRATRCPLIAGLEPNRAKAVPVNSYRSDTTITNPVTTIATEGRDAIIAQRRSQ